MKEIVERLQENRNIEQAKKIMESAGYKVSKTLDESAVDEFWDLYDRDRATGAALEKIADELGIGSDSEPTEEEARKILSVYKGEGGATLDTDELIEEIMSACEEISGISSARSFDDAGMMTKNKGFILKDSNGKEYQFSLLGSF